MNPLRQMAGTLVALAILTASLSCQTHDADDRLTIAAAADLRFAMDELIADFQHRRGGEHAAEIRVIYGSSGNFYAQLTQRAPFDLYLSADIAYPKKLVDAGLAMDDDHFEYAIGRLVIWTSRDSPVDVEGLRWEALQAPGVRRIAVANPDHAPYGEAAVAALRQADRYDEVADRLVFGENIAQAAQFVDTGAAEIGIIALSIAIAPEMADRGLHWEIPLETFPPLRQGGLIPRWSSQPELAGEFRDYLVGPHGQEILSRYGFLSPGSLP